MSTITHALRATPALIITLADKLRALQWTRPDGTLEPAFQRVEVCDLEDLMTALDELTIVQARVCLVMPDSERFDTALIGQQLQVTQTREVHLLILDRHVGKRQKALLGGENTPGILALKDLVLAGVTGLTQAGVYCAPLDGSILSIQGKQREQQSGRTGYALTLQLRGGEFRTSLGNPSIV